MATAKTDLIIDSNGIERKWITQYPLFKNGNERIKWESISRYSIEPQRNWQEFKIISKKGYTLTIIHHNDFDNKDDFLIFIDNFKLKIAENNASGNDKTQIKKAPDIYEGKSGVVILTIGVVSLIILTAVIANSKNQSQNSFRTTSLYLGIFYFIFQVLIHRDKNQ